MQEQLIPKSPRDLPVLSGDLVILRQPSPDDVAIRLEVPADPELHRMYGGSGDPKPMTPERAQAFVASIDNQDVSRERKFFIAARRWPDGRPVESATGRCIGQIRLNIVSWEDQRARMAMGIFDPRFWSHGYGTESLRLILGYGFDTVGLHRIDLRVIEYNMRAIRCYEKCGFIREGIERESGLVDGVWYNDVMMSILEDEYRDKASLSSSSSSDDATVRE